MSNDVAPSTSAAPEILTTTETQLKEGIDALHESHYEEAVSLFEEVLKARTAHFGELALESALPSYYYGYALLHLAQSTRDVFADESDAAKQDTESEDEEGPSDLRLAWEAIECARHIYEKQSKPHLSRLASVHVVLGDIDCETSNFPLALKEYTTAISYLEQLPDKKEGEEKVGEDREGEEKEGVETGTQSVNRRFCEAYYKACLASEFVEELEQASEYCEKAIDSIRCEMLTKSEGEALEDLKGIEKELMESKEVIQMACKEKDKVKDLLRQMFEQHASQSEPAKTEKKEVIDLGMVGRGTRRLMTKKPDLNEKSGEDKEAKKVQTPSKRLSSSVNDEDENLSKRKKTEENVPAE